MKIFINAIPEEGIKIKEVLDPKKLELDTQGVKFISPIQVEAFVTRDKKNVFIDINLTSKIGLECSKCLATYETPYSKDIMLDFPIEGQYAVETDEDLRQEIILDYPMRPLCKKDCKGLCPKCGQNLNEGACKC